MKGTKEQDIINNIPAESIVAEYIKINNGFKTLEGTKVVIDKEEDIFHVLSEKIHEKYTKFGQIILSRNMQLNGTDISVGTPYDDCYYQSYGIDVKNRQDIRKQDLCLEVTGIPPCLQLVNSQAKYICFFMANGDVLAVSTFVINSLLSSGDLNRYLRPNPYKKDGLLLIMSVEEYQEEYYYGYYSKVKDRVNIWENYEDEIIETYEFYEPQYNIGLEYEKKTLWLPTGLIDICVTKGAV